MLNDVRLCDIINGQIAAGDLSGAALLLIKDGKELYRNAFGCRDIESGDPMRTDAIFRMYSMSKPVTAAAVMLLLERGIISLDDPVSNYLDGFKAQRVYTDGGLRLVERQCTIRDLLNMTSGIPYPDESHEPGRLMQALFDEQIRRYHAGRAWPTVEFANLIGEQPLMFEPGEKWMYGLSADILGAVIEAASGMRFGEFLRREIFEPLGMADTDFYVPAEKRGRFATMYRWNENTVPRLKRYDGDHIAVFDMNTPPAFESGGAGLASTLDDYARFAAMLLNNGEYCGRRILKPETAAFMRSGQLTPAQQRSFDWTQYQGFTYGNLMCHMVDSANINPVECGAGANGCYGWDGWAGTHHMTDPANGLIMLYFISRVDYPHMPKQGALRRAAYDMLGL